MVPPMGNRAGRCYASTAGTGPLRHSFAGQQPLDIGTKLAAVFCRSAMKSLDVQRAVRVVDFFPIWSRVGATGIAPVSFMRQTDLLSMRLSQFLLALGRQLPGVAVLAQHAAPDQLVP